MPLTISLPGAAECFRSATAVTLEAIEEDRSDEIESLESTWEVDECQEADPDYVCKLASIKLSEEQKIDLELLADNLKKASEHIIVTSTRAEYSRLWIRFKAFCTRVGYVDTEEEIKSFTKDVPADFPQWICVWIMEKADEIDIYTGKMKDPSINRLTYVSAQKMRAAISQKFGHDYGLGTQPWTENPLSPGKFVGNPSLSVTVSQYMVRAGLTITKDADPKCGSKQKRAQSRPEGWAGKSVRVMLQLLYMMAMLCLLCFDEALRISWGDVHFKRLENGLTRVCLELPFCKTHQNGDNHCGWRLTNGTGIAPFWLYPDTEKPWICPVRMFASWWSIVCESASTPQGYIFHKKIGKSNFSVDPECGMSAESFLKCFCNNLLDIGVDPRPYGMHSFHRGGCQFLALVRRWNFRRICDWAGWAENFDNPGTIFKYLLS
ncbi:hypothetical protein BKA93DRAFT_749085 [Sparassis latifolia]